MDKLFSVEELAKHGNATPRAIRLYIDKGLLKPMRIGRMLCFPEAALAALEKILRAKRLGFKLDEIGARRGGRNTAVIKGAIRRIEELMSDAEDEISDLKRRLDQPKGQRIAKQTKRK